MPFIARLVRLIGRGLLSTLLIFAEPFVISNTANAQHAFNAADGARLCRAYYNDEPEEFTDLLMSFKFSEVYFKLNCISVNGKRGLLLDLAVRDVDASRDVIDEFIEESIYGSLDSQKTLSCAIAANMHGSRITVIQYTRSRSLDSYFGGLHKRFSSHLAKHPVDLVFCKRLIENVPDSVVVTFSE